MKHFTALLALPVFSLFISCERQNESSGKNEEGLIQLSATLDQKVVSIETYSADGKSLGTGSGFFISENGRIATCAHLVEKAHTVFVKALTGAEFKFVGIISMDAEKDLAILSVVAERVSYFETKENSNIPIGARIAVYGNPRGFKGTLTDGVVSAIRSDINNTKYFQISAPISPGSSGSPVVTMNGKLVGMVGFKASDSDSIGFALAANEISADPGKSPEIIEKDTIHLDALNIARKKYLPSTELWEDSEWNRGNLPETPFQRLAILRRLQGKYPDDQIIPIKIVIALRESGNQDHAFQTCSAILENDPTNRLALSEMMNCDRPTAEKLALLNLALAADPLNFRAHQYLASVNDIELMNRGTANEVPFSIKLSQLNLKSMHQRALKQSIMEDESILSIYGDLMIDQINDIIVLRKLIASAGNTIINPTEDNLTAFINLAEIYPSKAFPYAWDLMQAGKMNWREELSELMKSTAGERLVALIRDTVNNDPIIAEMYLLDPGSADVNQGLLFREISEFVTYHVNNLTIKDPFDYIAALFFFEDFRFSKNEDSYVISPHVIKRWAEVVKQFNKLTVQIEDVRSTLYDRPEVKIRSALIFELWLSVKKHELEEKLRNENIPANNSQIIREALAELESTPSVYESTNAFRKWMEENPNSLMDFDTDFRLPIRLAIDAAIHAHR